MKIEAILGTQPEMVETICEEKVSARRNHIKLLWIEWALKSMLGEIAL